MDMNMNNGRKKGNTYCCVPQCKNYNQQGLSFHIFPADKNLRKLWETVLGLEKPSSNFMKVCSAHFAESDYFPGVSRIRRKLKQNVIPSKKLPEGKHIQLTERKPVCVQRSYERTPKKKKSAAALKSHESKLNTAAPNCITDEEIDKIQMEKVEIKCSLDNIINVPLEFERYEKVDKECFVDIPYCVEQENKLICNRFVCDKKTCEVEIQTCIAKEPMNAAFQGIKEPYIKPPCKRKSSLEPCKQETSPDNTKSNTNVLLESCKRQCSSEILPCDRELIPDVGLS